MADDGELYDTFGSSVATHGDWLAIGAPGADYLSDDNRGAVYMFRLDAVTHEWDFHSKLVDASGVSGDFFGCALAIVDDTLVVGAYSFAKVYVWQFDGVVWNMQHRFQPQLPAVYFGLVVAFDGQTIVVGDTGDLTFYPSYGTASFIEYNGNNRVTQQKVRRFCF